MSTTQPREHGRFASPNDEPLAKQVIGIRLPESVHEVVYPLPERTAWLRRVITEAAYRELLPSHENLLDPPERLEPFGVD